MRESRSTELIVESSIGTPLRESLLLGTLSTSFENLHSFKFDL
jgi:hypothetical protein